MEAERAEAENRLAARQAVEKGEAYKRIIKDDDDDQPTSKKPKPTNYFSDRNLGKADKKEEPLGDGQTVVSC